MLAALLTSMAMSAQSQGTKIPRDLEPLKCHPAPSFRSERLICADPELRGAYVALSAAYKQKAVRLDANQINALRIDHNLWYVRACLGDITGHNPPPDDVVRACLREELPKHRQFVLDLSVDPPERPWLLSGFERGLLRRYAEDVSPGLVNGMYIVKDDGLRLALKRVFAATLPAVLAPASAGAKRDAVSEFIEAIFMDHGYALEGGRYFLDRGQKPHDGGLQGRFLVDMETGEVALAIMSTLGPTLRIFEKACISPAFRDFSRSLFRESAERHVQDFRVGDQPVGTIAETVGSTPCK